MLWLTLLLPLCHAFAPRRISGYDIASHLFKKSVDFAADPCEDFFQFACGKWSDSTPIPTHASSVSHFSKLEDRIKKQLRGLFESPIVERSRSIMTLKAMYRKCTDMDELNRIGARQLIHFLSLRYGVWPMIHGSNRWSPTHFDLTHLMELMALRALSVFVGVDVALNPRNVARYAISITMGELALGKSSAHYYLDRKKHGKRIEAYRQLMFNETRLIHEDVNMSFEERKTMMYVDEIIEFETKLAKILNDAEEHKDPAKSHHIRRFSDLRLLLPLIDWERYFIHMSPRKVHRYLARNPKIVIENIDYLKRLTKLLQSTEPRIITNYMFVRFVRSRENELGDRFEDVVQSFDRVMLGKKTKTPRWKYCMHKNMERMKFASGALYVRNVFQTVTKKAAENMVADLRATMEELIREGNWMDMKTKEAALEKARMMLQHIAYPEFILNDRLLDKYYRGISIRETDSYSEMVEKFLRWQRRSSYEKLLHPADRNESELDAAEANAFYSSSRNSINIPAAILQAPLFDSTFPRALNYGGIGAIIGHEITHGFDDEGKYRFCSSCKRSPG
ncbi:hypothetical protein Q1695_013002 [Nippostrongylus brasiliensis]|nr:hypothetical protein Q1695_013002 [Nippostrongylus brasiliensis]